MLQRWGKLCCRRASFSLLYFNTKLTALSHYEIIRLPTVHTAIFPLNSPLCNMLQPLTFVGAKPRYHWCITTFTNIKTAIP